MSFLPIRVRLTLPFAVAMAAVLAALGAFVYARVGSAVLQSTDQALLAHATESTLRLDKGRPLLGDDSDGVGFAQVLNRAGHVVISDPAGTAALIDPSQSRRVAAGDSLRATVSIPGRSGRWRLLAIPEPGHGTLVVGSSLTVGDESLENLRHELLIASPLALLLAALAGYMLAGAALRPVEEMRRKAGAISAATPGSRLPVPRARDEVSRLAETLNFMLDRLEAAFEHERRFVADASHELRTPLALLRTELELALRHPRSREELEQALRSAAEDADRLSELAADLLLIARSDQRTLPVQPEPLSSAALFTSVADRFAARARELGRKIDVDPTSDVVFDADPRPIEQALANLVENALVHGAGTVTLSARRAEGHVELHVQDEGAGFPPGFAARAFDRFSRADEARPRSGSGLGLAIVRTIAAAHGGSAAVSEDGAPDAWILLPAATGRPARHRPESSVATSPDAASWPA
jgi:two-component system OmpR family sensor kinase